MNLNFLAQLVASSGVAICLCATPGLAKHCQDVGGGVLTNFLDSTHTEGTSTGDIRGAIGVAILGVSSGPNGTTVYHVQHHWVTDSGDTIFLKEAFLTTFPTSDPNRVLGDYLDGVEFMGGTGRFEGATGKAFVFGAADPNWARSHCATPGRFASKPSRRPNSASRAADQAGQRSRQTPLRRCVRD